MGTERKNGEPALSGAGIRQQAEVSGLRSVRGQGLRALPEVFRVEDGEGADKAVNTGFVYAIRALGAEVTDEWRDRFLTEAEDAMLGPHCQVLEHQAPVWQEPIAYFDEDVGMEAKQPGYWMVVSIVRG